MGKPFNTRRGSGPSPAKCSALAPAPRDHYQEVTDRVVAALEAGTLPWRRPWASGHRATVSGMPCNAISGRAYRGVNAVLLAMTQFAHASEDPRWLTYLQAAEHGCQVRRGERGTPVVFFKRLEVHGRDRETASSRKRCEQIEADLKLRLPTRGDLFGMEVGGRQTSERRIAGASLLSRIRILAKECATGQWTLGRLGGFDIKAEGRSWGVGFHKLEVWLDRTGFEQELKIEEDLTAMGLVSRLEYLLDRMEVDLAEHRRRITEAEARVSGFQRRLGEAFAYEGELDAKQAELDAIEADLGANAAAPKDSGPDQLPAAA